MKMFIKASAGVSVARKSFSETRGRPSLTSITLLLAGTSKCLVVGRKSVTNFVTFVKGASFFSVRVLGRGAWRVKTKLLHQLCRAAYFILFYLFIFCFLFVCMIDKVA